MRQFDVSTGINALDINLSAEFFRSMNFVIYLNITKILQLSDLQEK